MEELWDLYDKNRNPLGKKVARGNHDGCAAYHIVVFVAVKNSNGEYLITKRSPEKHFGGKWEFTGGSAVAGESSEQAAIREAFEETGIDHTNSKRRFLGTQIAIWDDGKLGWHGDFDDIWLFEADFPIETVRLQEHETTDAKWVSVDELLELKADGSFSNHKILSFVLSSTEGE